MKLVLKTFLFHAMCILFFSIVYRTEKKSFDNLNENSNFIDFLSLSTTIQAGVGYSKIYPNNDWVKTLMIIQQLLMISTNIFTIYIFTL
jgi:hypothetical protein